MCNTRRSIRIFNFCAVWIWLYVTEYKKIIGNSSHMLKMWPTKIFLKIIVPIFQPMVLYYILECQTSLACLVYCTLQNVWAICRLHSMLHAAMAVSISHAVVCDTMFMFTDLPLRSGWRSCSLAPQHPALTGLLTSRGGQCHCAMWSQCHSPFSSVSGAPSPVSSSSSKDSPSISFLSFMSLDSVLSMAPSMSVL